MPGSVVVVCGFHINVGPCNPSRLQTYVSCFAAELFSVLLRVYHEHRLCNFSTSYMSCRMSCRMPMLGGHTATPWLRPRSCNGPHRGKNACRFAMQLFKRYGWCTIFCQLRFDRSIHVWLSLRCILFWFVAPRSPNVNVDWQNMQRKFIANLRNIRKNTREGAGIQHKRIQRNIWICD